MQVRQASGVRAILIAILFALGVLAPGWRAQEGDDEPGAEGSPEWDDPDLPVDPRFEAARQHHVRGEFAEAFAIYEQILADRGADAPTLVTYGNMRWKIGEMGEAERLLKAAIASMPTHVKAHQFLGQLYYHQGRRREARAVFENMLTLKWMREDVGHSARLNLARIDLLDEKWLPAREGFGFLKKEGNKADRKSGERGVRLIKDRLALDEWPRQDSRHLRLHMSPKLTQYSGPEAKKALTDPVDAWIDMVVDKLGIAMPEPWPVYLFASDDECSFMTGRKAAHGWDYSWWTTYNAMDSGFGLKHDLAVQLLAHWGGSRPISRSLFEGMCVYVAGEVADPHASARALAATDDLPSLVQLQKWQRLQDQVGCGSSWVRFLIDRHGIEKFGAMWKHFNVICNAPQFKIGQSKEIDWEKALDTLFKQTLGEGYEAVQEAWEAALTKT